MKLLSNFLSYRREPFEPRVYLETLIRGVSISRKEAEEFMEEVTDGNLTDAQIAAFLTAFNAKGIAPEEIAGCAAVLQRKRVPLELDGPLLDTCGTGGDGLGTFNISSLTALAAASCGATVAKHGNRAVSSRSGSADFYRALGIGIEISPERAAASIREAGFAFLYAPIYHGAMRFAAPARRQLGIKTIMNLLGPLVNPAGAQFQLIGVFDEQYMELVARAAMLLGIRRGMVVHGLDGQDEISVCSPSRVISFSEDGPLEEFMLEPETYGLTRHDPRSLAGGTAEENALIARRLLDGETGIGPQGVVDPVIAALHDAVVLNTAAALVLYGTVQTIRDGVELAARALEEGRVARTLETVISVTAGAGA